MLCRLCLTKTDDFLDIFSENGQKLCIEEIIRQHFWFEINIPESNQEHAEILCQECWKHLLEFHTFYTNIQIIHGLRLDGKNDPPRSEDCLKPDIDEINSSSNGTISHSEDDYFSSFFNMNCELCDTHCSNLSDIRAHYESRHQKSGYVTCCAKKFTSERTMRQHIKFHIYPEELKCDYCGKTFSKKDRLLDHILMHADPECRPYKCNKCEKAFVKQCRLFVHQKLKHSKDEEKVFACNRCEKKFALEHLLRSHTTNAHTITDSFICDICAKVLSSYSNFLVHKKLIHDKTMPQVQCLVCNIWLLNRNNLRKHMKIHTDGEQSCPYCFRHLKNRRTLQSHILELHSDRKTFNCNICGKEFRRKLNLREHMSSHTGTVLYSCKFCAKTFKSSAYLYKHRKIFHPDEYQRSKDKPDGLQFLKDSALFQA